MGSFRLSCALCAALCGLACSVRGEEAAERPISFLDQLHGKVPKSITGNPAAESNLPGSGLAGRILHLPAETGLRLGGLARRCQRLDVDFELGPAGKPVLARDCVLSVGQLRIRDADLQFA